METIVPISRIERLALEAAARPGSAEKANPYPAHSAAGKLFLLIFEIQQNRIKALVMPAQAAIETVAV